MTEEIRKRANYLTVTQVFNLDVACKALTKAFGHRSYQVGSSLLRPNYRDVDIRCILDDEKYDQWFEGSSFRLKFLNTAISEWLQARTNLPIDFQFQRMTDANAEFDGIRNPVGTIYAGE